MTEEQRNKCHMIIHGHAVAAGAGNAVPVPGLGVAAAVATMASMALALSAVFGSSIPENVARNLAISALKRTVLKQPIKTIGKEVGKLIPFVGSYFAATVSVGMLEAAGWSMAEQLDREASRY